MRNVSEILTWAPNFYMTSDEICDQVARRIISQIHYNFEFKVNNQVEKQVGTQVRNQIGTQVRNQIGNEIWSQSWSRFDDQVNNFT